MTNDIAYLDIYYILIWFEWRSKKTFHFTLCKLNKTIFVDHYGKCVL